SHGEGSFGGLEANAAEAQSGLGGSAVVLEAVALGEVLGEQLGAVAEGLVEPGAEASGGIDHWAVVVLVDGQAHGRTMAGHGPPPRVAGCSNGESWPFPCFRLLYACLKCYPAPQSGTVRKKGQTGAVAGGA